MPRFVGGEGPKPCDLMFIGEGPGYEEDKYGRPFVGKSGKELDRYIWNALRRRRSSVYISNLVKYRVPDDGDPSAEDIARDEGILRDELARVRPEVVCTLGAHSTRWFLGECDVDMDWANGVAFWDDRGFAVMPVVHPAAGLHSPEFQAKVWYGFERLAKLLKGEDVWVKEDQYPKPWYFDGSALHRVVLPGGAAVDTEGSVRRPWCLSATSTYGEAIVCRPGRARFSVAATFERRLKLHNSLHDLGVLRAMGIDLEDGTYDDTMVKAYELGIEPQGLKSLARRHCGMRMNEYLEVLGGAQTRHNELWLSKVLSSVSKGSVATGRQKSRSTSAPAGRRSSRTSPKKRHK